MIGVIKEEKSIDDHDNHLPKKDKIVFSSSSNPLFIVIRFKRRLTYIARGGCVFYGWGEIPIRRQSEHTWRRHAFIWSCQLLLPPRNKLIDLRLRLRDGLALKSYHRRATQVTLLIKNESPYCMWWINITYACLISKGTDSIKCGPLTSPLFLSARGAGSSFTMKNRRLYVLECLLKEWLW